MEKNKDYLGAITLYDVIGIGGASKVYICEYLDMLFAYKKILSPKYAEFIDSKLKRVSEYYCDKDYVFPYKFIYGKPIDNFFKGYLIDYLYAYEKLGDFKDLLLEEKIDLLKKARDKLDNFHNKYNCVHGDICPWNYLYNEKYTDLKIIDFDSNIDLNKKDIKDISYYNDYTREYIKNIGVAKKH